MKPAFAIHGHFYQPPRNDPFTKKIPNSQKNGSYDWNSVINQQCYKPNAQIGNFSLMTFDLYRSLAEWLQENDLETYNIIVQSDKQKYIENGLGTAFGGSWDHAILPLLRDEDIDIEVYWGNVDYQNRFNHVPIGFWLAETAVSNKVLDILAKNGIRLVILAPWQASNPIDTQKLYWVELKEGRRITVAFYNNDISSALSFDNESMQSVQKFTDKYIKNQNHKENTLCMAATDGERYGHHLQYGEKFLNALFKQDSINSDFVIEPLTQIYSQLQTKDQAYIVDNSSWSCLCGDLKRWKQDCDCNVAYERNNQRVSGEWKATLFNAIYTVSDEIVRITDKMLQLLVKDPHAAKKEYVHVYLRQITESEFVNKHSLQKLQSREILHLLKICAMQIYRLASFTSCGWFFADLDRPEPRIVIGNAKKALSMLGEIGKVKEMMQLEETFVSLLAGSKSNFTNLTGKDIYLEFQQIVTQ